MVGKHIQRAKLNNQLNQEKNNRLKAQITV